MTPTEQPRDAIALALQLLAKELQERLRRHPSAHLLNGGRESLQLTLRIPTLSRRGWVGKAREATSESLDRALACLLLHLSVFRPGHVYCLRCASVHCSHATPRDCHEVFAGYSPSGVAHFLDLGQWLLERRDPRIDLLYRSAGGFVAHLTSGADLTHQLLPAFHDADSGYHIHGQVAAGWYDFPNEAGFSDSVALTFQVVSTRPKQGRRRFGLNLIGKGPGDEPLEHLFDRVGEIPWLPAARWAQEVLRDVERLAARPSAGEDLLEKRLNGLLGGLARRLEHERRARHRKTHHGQRRHRGGARPTRKALADLEQAKDESILFDTRRRTLVVLGDRGRAHVFNRAGRLVTSVRYSPDSIDRRRLRGWWRPATAEQIEVLRGQAAMREDEGA